MELTIEHLAPYLPYQLNIIYKSRRSELLGVKSQTPWSKQVCVEVDRGIWSYAYEIKPILRPLSDFGESDDLRKVHEFIWIGGWCEAYDEYFNVWFNDLANIDKLVLQAPYAIFKYFLSEHYDVFDLIKSGLAVDINTL